MKLCDKSYSQSISPHCSLHIADKNMPSDAPNCTSTLRTNPHTESLAGLTIFPILAGGAFYLLSETYQGHYLFQFAPQIIAFGCFGVWAYSNVDIIPKLGFQAVKIRSGIAVGFLIGLVLGGLNTTLILYGAPALGLDIEFLGTIPHAHIPLPVMVPWFIGFIAITVELIFRGFLLGRLLVILSRQADPLKSSNRTASIAALGLSSLAFAFDPFMVTTFQHLHWIAVWDGFIWGWMWLRTRNLYIPIAAHFTEVMIEYLIIRAALA